MIKDSYIRECYEGNDIEGLRDIFVHAPDRDPSFEMFRNDYNECRDKLFEPHTELTPLADRSSGEWSSQEYLTKLHLDLMKNFSQRRYEHLLEVSRVYYKVPDKPAAPKVTPPPQRQEPAAPRVTPPPQRQEPAAPRVTPPPQRQEPAAPRVTPPPQRPQSDYGQRGMGAQRPNFTQPPQASDHINRANPQKGMSAEEKNRAAAERPKRTAITVGIVLAVLAVGAVVLLLLFNIK